MDLTTNRQSALLNVYSREKHFEPCERQETRLWDDFKEADDVAPRGKGLYFKILGASGRSVGTPGEAGSFGTHRPPREVECSVTPAYITDTLEISDRFLNASKDDGSYTGDEEHESIMRATKELYEFADVLMHGHGTGRLAVIKQATVAGDVIYAKAPEMAYQLREWEHIDIYDQDSGGTPQYTNLQILAIDWETGAITVDQNVTVSADWCIYHEDTYGTPKPNGLRNIVDDGDYASSIFGASRTTYPFLNAVVLDGNGGLQPYNEDLVRKLIDQIRLKQDQTPTQLRCNMGIINEHLRVTQPDRVYMQTGAALPTYSTGANQEGLAFTYGDKKIPFRPDRNMPARELLALHVPTLRKHTLTAADWFKGSGGSILLPRPSDGGGSYDLAWIACIRMDMNISSRRLNANGKLSNIIDRTGAGDE